MPRLEVRAFLGRVSGLVKGGSMVESQQQKRGRGRWDEATWVGGGMCVGAAFGVVFGGGAGIAIGTALGAAVGVAIATWRGHHGSGTTS